MTSPRPQLWVFAGPNGAGKSTLVTRHKVADRIPIVNPDDIARALRRDRHGEVSAMTQAGRHAVTQRDRFLSEGRSFGIETTLTGRSELHLMRTARTRGYKVTLVYIGLSEAEQSHSRVAMRVRRGGHDVPEDDVFRRFGRSLANLTTAIDSSDRVRILDNSGKTTRLLLSIDRGHARFVARSLPEWLTAAVPKKMRQPRRDLGMGW